MMTSSSASRSSTLTISRLTEKLLPEPGVPRTNPFGAFNNFRSSERIFLKSH